MFWENQAVLVTGGASFIGSHLVEKLAMDGARVRVADDLSSGSLSNLSSIEDDVEFLQGDLRHPDFAAKVVENCDVVFHLAASHGGRGYIDTHPVECSTNMILDGTVYAAAHRAGVERLCFASSACVYPTHLQDKTAAEKVVNLREEWADPFAAEGSMADGEYGWAKLMGEMALAAYVRQYGIKGVSCRIFTAYGERENESHAVIALIAKAFIQMDPFEIWGDGTQDRNFTYVSDIVAGLIKACESITDGSSINIGTEEHIKIIDAAKIVLARMGWFPNEFHFDKSKPVGVLSRAADLSRARRLLDWEPGTSFQEGAAKTIEWYMQNHNVNTVKRELARRLMER